MRVALLLLAAISSVTACTLIESKDGLVGPPLAGNDAGPPVGDAADPATDAGAHDASDDHAAGSSGGGSGSSGGSGGSSGGGSNDASPPNDAATGPVAIFTGRPAPLGLAVHAGVVCWVEGETFRSIACGPSTGGDPSTVTTVASQETDPLVESAFDVAFDDATLYWSNGPKNQVVTRARSGGNSAEYFTGDQQVSYIALEGTTIWVSDYVAGAASGNVGYGPFSGSMSQVIYPVEKQAAGVGTYGGSVYWGTPDGLAFGPESGNKPVSRVSTPGRVTGLALDTDGSAYLLSDNRDVYRIPLAQSTAQLVYSSQTGAFGDSDLALDDGAIYWTEHDTGRIVRLAK